MKCDIPGFPPLAHTQDLGDTLADIYAGKLSVDEAPEALKKLKMKKPPSTSFLVWLGVVTISVAFAVDAESFGACLVPLAKAGLQHAMHGSWNRRPGKE